MFRNQRPMQRGPIHFPQQQPYPFDMRRAGGGFGRQIQRNTESGGGLLSKLLKKQAQPQTAAMFSRAGVGAKPSFLQTLTNPQNINQFLSQTQNVLQAAQQFGPLVKQYGPIVKNLPAMWEIYKGLSASTEDETKSEDQDKVSANTIQPSEESDVVFAVKEDEETLDSLSSRPKQKVVTKPNKPRRPRESVPKLYIP